MPEFKGSDCPQCGQKSAVLETRNCVSKGHRRRRKCLICGELFTTYEINAATLSRYEEFLSLDSDLTRLMSLSLGELLRLAKEE